MNNEIKNILNEIEQDYSNKKEFQYFTLWLDDLIQEPVKENSEVLL
jgi:hypothetical protein